MKITYGKHTLIVDCTGCHCHAGLEIVMGNSIDKCNECGCPMTVKGFNELKRRREGA